MKNIVYCLVIMALISGCLKDDALNLPYVSYQPIDIADGIVLSTPADENMDGDALDRVYTDVSNNDDFWPVRSLLVFRNGKLVAENYYKSENDITDRHLIWSCTKQVVGILTGIAVEQQLIAAIEDPISDYFDLELIGHEDKGSITIKNMITMRSGIDYSNDGVGGETDKMLRQIPDNSVDFIVGLPLNAEQGTVFNYNDGNPHLMSALIQKTVGKPTDEWADEVFFSKIGLTNYNWVRYKDGVTLGGYGIETTPREMAKVALCISNHGRYNDTQIIDSNWVKEMVTPQVVVETLDLSFGYFWWVDVSRDIHFMWGHGGQFAFIVPSKSLVVVMTSLPNTQGDYQIQADEVLPIIDRIVELSY